MTSESYQALRRARERQSQLRDKHSQALAEWAPLKSKVITTRAQPGSELFERFDKARTAVVEAERSLTAAGREVQRLMDDGAAEQCVMTRRLM